MVGNIHLHVACSTSTECSSIQDWGINIAAQHLNASSQDYGSPVTGQGMLSMATKHEVHLWLVLNSSMSQTVQY